MESAASAAADRSGLPRPNTGALLAYVYELIDDGPELERHELVLLILERVSSLVDADAAVLWVVDDDGRAGAERFHGTRPSATAIRAERMLVELVRQERNGTMINTGEAPLSPGLAQLCDRLASERSGVVCVGLHHRQTLLGVLCLHRIGRGAFPNAEAADAVRFARFAAVAVHQMTERARAQRDEVTGMPGRAMLLRALDERLAAKRPFALACIDFDGLKNVNETKSYEAGNELIRAVARAIAGLLKPGELVGRLHGRGGDEFVCLLAEQDRESLERRCQLLEAALDRAVVPEELEDAYLGVSVGAALANVADATPVGSLFSAAEKAMRERKQERRRQQGRPPAGR